MGSIEPLFCEISNGPGDWELISVEFQGYTMHRWIDYGARSQFNLLTLYHTLIRFCQWQNLHPENYYVSSISLATQITLTTVSPFRPLHPYAKGIAMWTPCLSTICSNLTGWVFLSESRRCVWFHLVDQCIQLTLFALSQGI